MTGLLALLGLGVAGVGAAGLAAAAGRHPSQAQVTAAGQREQAVLWEQLSAGQIFPSSVSYMNTLGAARQGRSPPPHTSAAHPA